jgi:hypothetical protein
MSNPIKITQLDYEEKERLKTQQTPNDEPIIKKP